MTMSAATDSTASQFERQSFQRVEVTIYGRYMLADRSEFPCRVVEMSPGDLDMNGEKVGQPGERVVAYLDHIGRVEGRILHTMDDGFSMTVVASERKRDKLAAQLTWLANRHELDLPEDRRHERVVPRNPISTLRLPDDQQYQCRIGDLSLSGAALQVEVKPEIGTPVFLGAVRGRVVRHFEDGVAIEFAIVQERVSLQDALF